MSFMYFFFFQAEDGIRDGHVTGVQTCALPIYEPRSGRSIPPQSPFERSPGQHTRPDHGQSQADEEDDGVGQDVAAVVEDGLEAADDEAVENVDRQTEIGRAHV